MKDKKYIFIFLILTFLIFILSLEIHKSIIIEFEVENPQNIHNGDFYFTSKDKKYIDKVFSYKGNKVKIILNEKYIDSIRYDPMPSLGKITIKNIKINGSYVSKKNLVLNPIHNVKIIKNNNNKYTILSKGNDPYLILFKDIKENYTIDSIKLDYKRFLLLMFLIILIYLTSIFFNRNKGNIRDINSFISLFSIILFIMMILVYMFKFNFPNTTFLTELLFFDKFFLEFIIIFTSIKIFINKHKFSFMIGVIVVLVYIGINFSQLASFLISGEFLSRLAVANIEFIGLMINKENILIVFEVFFTLIVLPYILTKFLLKFKRIRTLTSSKVIILIIILLLSSPTLMNKIISDNKKEKIKELYKINHITHTAPIYALIDILKKRKVEEKYNFTYKDIQSIHNNFNFYFDPTKKYPLEKDYIFKKRIFKYKIKPNIIIIFTEGYSARTCNVYNSRFNNLTPNLVNFSQNKKSMTVYNYFNHTAATYRGLHGQLCSLYPKYGGVGGWHDNIKNLPKVDYKCMPHILKHNNYQTIWLNMHYKDASSNDEMMSHFGFNNIFSAQYLLKKYLSNTRGKRKDFLTDQESYQVLINFLNKNHFSQPFMIGIYTVQTHAWVDTSRNGIKYDGGKFNGLNTIHNMDNAFGKFWKWFKNSRYANDTIIVFTSDHAHYYEKSYIKAMKKYGEKDYQRVFVDNVPLIIYNPVSQLPKRYKTNNATSVDLIPTLLQMLNVDNEKNAFMGSSIFSQNEQHIGVTSIGEEHYIIKNGNIYDSFNINIEDQYLFDTSRKFINYTHLLETQNRLIEK